MRRHCLHFVTGSAYAPDARRMRSIPWSGLLLAVLLGGCALAPIQPPSAPIPAQPPATAPGTEPTVTPAPDAALIDDPVAAIIRDAFVTSLALTLPTDASQAQGFDGVAVVSLDDPVSQEPLWLVYTTGLRSHDPLQNHVVALYGLRTDNTPVERARLSLDETTIATTQTLAPDYLSAGSVTPVDIEPKSLWLQVQGGAGAHSGVYLILRFDGEALSVALSAVSASPGDSRVQDVNQDGYGEVLIDATDPYIFCYACGVYQPQIDLWRWNGVNLVPVTLSPLPVDTSLDLQLHNDRAIALANAGLWKDALAEIDRALMLGISEPSLTFAWNSLSIRLNADARAALLQNQAAAYPLLDHVFYGDFAGAVDLMQRYAPTDIFSPRSPLLVGTVAEGWETTLASWLDHSTTLALAQEPDLAPAHFLHGWGAFLIGESDLALADVRKAAELAPDNGFYAASAAYLAGLGADVSSGTLTPLTAVPVYGGPAATYPIIGALTEGSPIEVTGKFGDESDRWWQIAFTTAELERGWVQANPELMEFDDVQAVPFVAPPAYMAPIRARGHIYFSMPDAKSSSIFVIEPDAATEPAFVIADASQPAVSPLGDRLAFHSLRSDMLGLGGALLVSGERLRFANNVEDMLPDWNPIGDQLVFASTREGDRKGRIYHVWADGRGDAQAIGFGRDPAWHPGADQIVLKGCDAQSGSCGLYLMRIDGSERAALTDNPGDGRPAWSPDGSTVVFMSDQRDGNWEIYSVEVSSGAVTRLTNDPANDGLPTFSPDGKRIAFISNRAGVWAIWLMSTQGDAPTLLWQFSLALPNWLEQGLDWAP